jgi:hypothetical protein
MRAEWPPETTLSSSVILWLARQIQQHGPEPLWPSAAIAERSRRAREHG